VLVSRTVHPVTLRRSAIPTLISDLGRRLLEGVPLEARSVQLALITGTALLLVLLTREVELIFHPHVEQRVHRLDGAIVVLSVALATIVLERALDILL
jgi:hypothetical protein